MARNEIAVKKYAVRLSGEEREGLIALIHSGKSAAQLLTRARILLKADVPEAGVCWTGSAIAQALDISINTVARIRQQLVEEGFEAALTAQIQSKFRLAPDFRWRGGGQTDRPGLLASARGFRPMDPAAA